MHEFQTCFNDIIIWFYLNFSPHWRAVQLETAKLLELGCVLPATILPHFQMYRWAFVSSQNESSMTTAIDNYCDDSKGSAFVPHVARIAQLMDLRYTSHSPVTFLIFKAPHLKYDNHISILCRKHKPQRPVILC